MKSRISLFDRGVSRSLLRRFWPLWAAYFVILLLSATVSVSGALAIAARSETPAEVYLTNYLLQNAAGLLILSGIAAPIFAGAMFGHLYNKRMCGLMNSLPLRRETMFFTAWLTGLLPLLAADLLVALLSAAFSADGVRLPLQALLQWLAITVTGNLMFYNFAVFCGMLTGRKIFLPLLYLFLNFAAALLWTCAGSLTEALVFGYAQGDLPGWVKFLTPAVNLGDKLIIEPLQNAALSSDAKLLPDYRHANWGLLGVYTGLSFLFLLLGLLLCRRRQMEKAGDTVAVPWAAPVLKVLFCALFTVGFGLLLAELIIGGTWLTPLGSGWIMLLVFLLIGLFLGHFLSEMILRRTVRVFRGAWRGFLIGAAVLIVFVLGCRLDVLGYSRYVPAADEIAAVYISSSSSSRGRLEQPENLEAVTAMHREAVALRDLDPAGQKLRMNYLRLRYELKNGKTVERYYSLTTEAVDDKAILLCCEPESLTYRVSWLRGRVREAELGLYDGDGKQTGSLSLDAAQVEDLLENGLLPDARLGRVYLPSRAYETARHGVASYRLFIYVTEADDWGDAGYRYIRLYPDSKNSIRWIEAFLAQGGSVAASGL